MADYDLKKAIMKLGSKRFNFVLLVGKKADHILITPKKPQPKQIDALEGVCGAMTRLAKGTVSWEDNVLTFASKKKPLPAWEHMAKVIFRTNKCGMFLPVVFRQLGDTEDEEVEATEDEASENPSSSPAQPEATEAAGEQTAAEPPPLPPRPGTPPPPPPPPPSTGAAPSEQKAPTAESPEMAAFKARIEALKPALMAAIAQKTTRGNDAKLKISEAAVFARKNDFVQADRLLDEAGTLLGLSAGAPPPPPPPPGTAPSEQKAPVAESPEMAAFKARIEALKPALMAAIAQKATQGNDAKLKVSEAAVFARKNDFVQADRLLDEAGTLLGLSAGSPPPPPPQPGTAPSEQKAPVAESPEMAAFKARIEALKPALMAAIAQKTTQGNDAKLKVSEAAVFARKNDFAQANRLLDDAEALIKQTDDEEGPLLKTMDAWNDARDIVNGQISKLQAKLRQANDPDFAYIAEYGLNGITKRLQVGLQAALMEFDNASGDNREKARARARAAIKEFDSFLASDKVVAVLEENPFGSPVTLQSTLGRALNRIEKTLKG